jgi:delta-lactam-biosynthetic de-N-acetylase
MVKKKVAPFLLLAALLTACGNSKPLPVPDPTPAPVNGGQTASTGSNEKPPEPDKPKVDAVQAMGWYQPDIGYPLKSDDPKAADVKVAMLTFDDGPDKDVTPKVLDTLKKENIKAIFFVTGYGVQQNPDLLKRIAAEGHIIAVHTMTHPNLSKLSQAEQRKEIEPLMKMIQDLTGQKPKYMRPPFGAYNKDLLDLCKELGLEVVNWSNGSLDWDGLDGKGYKDPQKIVSTVLEQLVPGSNILMHDTHQHTAEALPKLIQALRERGYTFVVLGNQ